MFQNARISRIIFVNLKEDGTVYKHGFVSLSVYSKQRYFYAINHMVCTHETETNVISKEYFNYTKK